VSSFPNCLSPICFCCQVADDMFERNKPYLIRNSFGALISYGNILVGGDHRLFIAALIWTLFTGCSNLQNPGSALLYAKRLCSP